MSICPRTPLQEASYSRIDTDASSKWESKFPVIEKQKKKSMLYKGILYFSEKEFTIAPNYNVDELHKYNIKQKRKIQYMYNLVEAQGV